MSIWLLHALMTNAWMLIYHRFCFYLFFKLLTVLPDTELERLFGFTSVKLGSISDSLRNVSWSMLNYDTIIAMWGSRRVIFGEARSIFKWIATQMRALRDDRGAFLGVACMWTNCGRTEGKYWETPHSICGIPGWNIVGFHSRTALICWKSFLRQTAGAEPWRAPSAPA